MLNGGDGNDRLLGGSGADRFVFNHAPDAATNRDTVVDFAVGIDKIVIDHAIFAGFSAGVLGDGQFTTGSPGDGNAFIVYDQAAVR